MATPSDTAWCPDEDPAPLPRHRPRWRRPSRWPQPAHPQVIERATQGHVYQHGDQKVLSLESGRVVTVAIIRPGEPWFTSKYTVNAAWLTPLPMAYFHGQTPR